MLRSFRNLLSGATSLLLISSAQASGDLPDGKISLRSNAPDTVFLIGELNGNDFKVDQRYGEQGRIPCTLHADGKTCEAIVNVLEPTKAFTVAALRNSNDSIKTEFVQPPYDSHNKSQASFTFFPH